MAASVATAAPSPGGARPERVKALINCGIVTSRPSSKSRHLGLAAALAIALVPSAQSAVQPRTTAPAPVTNVKITITDGAIRMHPKLAQRGTMARFILVNVGKKPHTFELGRERRGTGKQTGFTKSLGPNQQSVLILFLDFRGVLPYRGTLPADQSKPAMKGIFRIV